MRLRTWIAAAAIPVVAVTAGCTPLQRQQWLDWHRKDPAAAVAYANKGCPGTTGCQLDGARASSTSSGTGCQGIYNEMIRQGASSGVARNFAYVIAPRESGCSPQYVHDSDDWSYSRFGLNGLTAGLRANWMSWCGADVRYDTRILSTDVRCALAAYQRMGWRPWS